MGYWPVARKNMKWQMFGYNMHTIVYSFHEHGISPIRQDTINYGKQEAAV